MKINTKKTKVMRITHLQTKNVKIFINGKKVEAVSYFKYLGSTITDDGRCETEIKRRIGKAKSTFMDNEALLASNINMKRSILSCKLPQLFLTL